MGNCLVTKLNGVVDSNLPILGKVVLDYVAAGATKGFLIQSGSNATKITFASSVHVDTAAGTLITEATIAANDEKAFYFDDSTPNTERMVVVDNIYDIKILTPYSECLSFANGSSGLSSLKYNNNLLWTGGIDFDLSCVPDGLKRLSIGRTNSGEDINFDDILAHNNLQIINGQNPYSYYDANNIFMVVTTATKANTSIRAIGTKIRGSIANLPVNTTCLYFNASTLTGNVEDFIANARTVGRTSGSIMFRTKNWSGVKFNNQSLSSQTFSLENPVISWTANSITAATSIPSEVTTVDNNYKTQYGWEPL